MRGDPESFVRKSEREVPGELKTKIDRTGLRRVHHRSAGEQEVDNPELEHIALFRREKVDGFPMTFPATATTLKM